MTRRRVLTSMSCFSWHNYHILCYTWLVVCGIKNVSAKHYMVPGVKWICLSPRKLCRFKVILVKTGEDGFNGSTTIWRCLERWKRMRKFSARSCFTWSVKKRRKFVIPSNLLLVRIQTRFLFLRRSLRTMSTLERTPCSKDTDFGNINSKKAGQGSRDGAVVRALASHQCVPGSIPGPGVICGLSLLLVLFSAPRGFSPGTPVFPSPQKPTFPNSNSSLESAPD